MRRRGSVGLGRRRQQRCEGDTPAAAKSPPASSSLYAVTLAHPKPQHLGKTISNRGHQTSYHKRRLAVCFCLGVQEHGTQEALEAVRTRLLEVSNDYKYFVHLAVTLALSKLKLRDLCSTGSTPFLLSVRGHRPPHGLS